MPRPFDEHFSAAKPFLVVARLPRGGMVDYRKAFRTLDKATKAAWKAQRRHYDVAIIAYDAVARRSQQIEFLYAADHALPF
jgi:hypothetical protein